MLCQKTVLLAYSYKLFHKRLIHAYCQKENGPCFSLVWLFFSVYSQILPKPFKGKHQAAQTSETFWITVLPCFEHIHTSSSLFYFLNNNTKKFHLTHSYKWQAKLTSAILIHFIVSFAYALSSIKNFRNSLLSCEIYHLWKGNIFTEIKIRSYCKKYFSQFTISQLKFNSKNPPFYDGL